MLREIIIYNKTVGRFGLFLHQQDCEIRQTHANGSDEEIARFIQLDLNNLRDLQFVVNRSIEEVEDRIRLNNA